MRQTALILAGGAGTRLWPLSSDANPKQFLPLFGGESLLQKTWRRLSSIVPRDSIFISTNERYRARCIEQLPDLDPANIIAEPARRNTGPAIALSCFEIESRVGEVSMAVLPADAHIADEAAFDAVLDRAFSFAERSDYLVTIGIDPTEAHTGYGYLELGSEVEPGVIALNRFTEKPQQAEAESFFRAGNYVWNAGIFVWRSTIFRNVLGAVAPDIARLAGLLVNAPDPDDRRQLYDEMPSISIDYALMEKAPRVAAIRGDFGWSDVGSWSAVARLSASPPTVSEDSANIFAYSESRKPIVTIGVSNVAVIEAADGILVLDLGRGELLSKAVKKISG